MTSYDSPSAVIPELEQLLLETSAGRVATTPAPRRAPRRRRRRAFGIMFDRPANDRDRPGRDATVAPVLGGDRQGHPTVASESLPAGVVARYEVLRRPRAAGDGDASVLAALRMIGEQNHGVHVDDIRRLGDVALGRRRGPGADVPVRGRRRRVAGGVGRERAVRVLPAGPAGRPADGAGYPVLDPAQLASGHAVGRVAAAPALRGCSASCPTGSRRWTSNSTEASESKPS